MKEHFQTHGKGWIAAGILALILFIGINMATLLMSNDVIDNAEKQGKSALQFIISFWLPRILTASILFVFIPFSLAFFGFKKLFWLLIGWEIIVLLLGLLNIGSIDTWGPGLIIYSLFIMVVLVGIIWEALVYRKNKNR